MLTKCMKNKQDENYTRMLHAIWNNDKQDIWGTAGETRTNSQVMFFYEPLHMDVPLLANQQELTSTLCEHWL